LSANPETSAALVIVRMTWPVPLAARPLMIETDGREVVVVEGVVPFPML
jgi:hypothetical protein